MSIENREYVIKGIPGLLPNVLVNDVIEGCSCDSITKPFRCPVCLGRGQVEPGFYVLGGSASTSATNETCRSCSGSGIFWQVQ